MNTNITLLKNDFARTDEAGTCDKSGLYDYRADPGLEAVQVIKNTIGEGVGYHLKYVRPDEPRWFLIGNQYRSWTNWTATTNLLVDPLATYYHFQP